MTPTLNQIIQNQLVDKAWKHGYIIGIIVGFIGTTIAHIISGFF